MAITESAFRTLDRIAQIKTVPERAEAVREECRKQPALALVFQYTYHPDVVFDLPEGELPKTIYKPATHDEYATFYQQVKKLRNFFTTSPVKKHTKELNFTVLCETVCAEDLPLLFGMKDKKLPWRALNKKFAVKALPELFPPDMKAEDD